MIGCLHLFHVPRCLLGNLDWAKSRHSSDSINGNPSVGVRSYKIRRITHTCLFFNNNIVFQEEHSSVLFHAAVIKTTKESALQKVSLSQPLNSCEQGSFGNVTPSDKRGTKSLRRSRDNEKTSPMSHLIDLLLLIFFTLWRVDSITFVFAHSPF